MYSQLRQTIESACHELFGLELAVQLSRTDEQFGDFSTNVAMQLAKPLGRSPHEIAQSLCSVLERHEQIASVAVAGPGFINITLKDGVVIDSLALESDKPLDGLTLVVEYSDPNPFKVLHVGHLYTSVVGDAIANMLEKQGATVHRVNFGGDVGLHAAKAMWGILQKLGGEYPEKLGDIREEERADWISACYVAGNSAYESGEAKEEIVEINKHIYALHEQQDRSTPFAYIYWTTRQWSYDYFNAFYATIGTKFERYYPESETAPIGLEAVKTQLENGVYSVSDGAIIFDGEAHGLHKRVFINSAGLPTYETKDVGLALKKWEDYHFDGSIMITGGDIIEYMKVVLKSIEQFAPEITERTVHITHGMVKLAGGVKMSSRLGNFLKATDVLDMVKDADPSMNHDTVLAATKYAFLKQAIGQDVIFDPASSVAIEGNSGPYLQYAHARAVSVLAKASKPVAIPEELNKDERRFAVKLSEYNEVLDQASTQHAPHQLCEYLYELAQVFNRFYEQNRVIGNEREGERRYLIERYASVLNQGLSVLGIHAPDSM